MSDQSNSRLSLTRKLLLLSALCGGAIFATMGQAQDAVEDSDAVTNENLMDNQRLGKLLKQHFPNSPFQGNGNGVWMIQADGDPDKKEPDADADATDPATDENGAIPKEKDAAEVDVMNGMLLVMTDERANRMRVMMPIQAFDSSKAEDLKTALIVLHANYDRALDARYAVSEGILWSAFLHPLSSLTEQDLASAIEQVRTLRKNTGTSYSSGAFQFAPRVKDPNQQQADEPPGDPTV